MSQEATLLHSLTQPAIRTPVDPLMLAARIWYGLTAIGQLAFLLYILGFYGKSILLGQFATWNKVLAGGYVEGDSIGNVSVGAHTVLAAIIMLCGALQLLPALRRRAPAVHRWSGRVYVALAIVTSMLGFGLMWMREVAGGTVMKLGLSGDALLILVFSFMAVRHARAGRFAAHQVWALRLFMAVSAVWFFRVGLMFWIFVNGGPAGFDPDSFRGPFINFLAFAQYLLPLAVLELYLCAGRSRSRPLRALATAVLGAASTVLVIGIGIAVMGLWWPRLS